MQVENAYQRWVDFKEDLGTRIYYCVLDSNGKETQISYRKDSKEFLCTCEAGTFEKPCGHVRVCKEFEGMK
jgi:hypothetical protein